MPGRPADPNYSTRSFAPDTNYPTGPETWSSNPTKVEPPGASSVGFEPDTGASAQEVNKVFFDLCEQGKSAKISLQALYEYVGALPALNFRLGVAEHFLCAAWNAAEKKWYFGKAGKVIKSSPDLGSTVSADLLSALAGTNDITGMAADPAGNMIAVTSGTDYYEYTASSATWSRQTGGGAWATSPTAGSVFSVAYDATAGTWIIRGCSGGAAYTLFYSTDRVTWTASAGETDGSSAALGVVAAKPGLVVSAFKITAGAGAGDLKVATSTDGGANFTLQSNVVTGFTPTHVSLTYEPDSALFVLVAATSAGAGQTRVWTSADGATWTVVCTLTAACLARISCIGVLWVAHNVETGALAYSPNAGATWRSSNFAPASVAAFENLHAANGHLVYLDASRSYIGLRAGDGTGPVLT